MQQEREELKIDDSKKNKTAKNVILIALSNICNIIGGCLLAFLVPAIMKDVSEYAYYKTFALYASYITLLHFGLNDGIFIKYAGTSYDDLDKPKFIAFTRLLFLSQIIVASVFIVLATVVFSGVNRYIFILVGANILGVNVINYFEYISQIASRFKLVALGNVCKGLFTIISICVLLLLNKTKGFHPSYIVISLIVVGVNVLIALAYVIKYRKLTFAKGDRIKKHQSELKDIYKTGFISILSAFIAQLIFVCDQQTVKILFTNEEFGIYAFAYNIVTLIIIASQAASAVLFPTLNKSTQEEVCTNYPNNVSTMLRVMALMMALYFPLYAALYYALPAYRDSLIILRVILPGLFISSTISVINGNMYKRLGHVKRFLVYAIIILLISIGFNLATFFIFKDKNVNVMALISLSSVIVIFMWYILTEQFLIRKYKVKWVKNLIYILLITAAYYLCFFVKKIYLSAMLYLAFYLIITLVLYLKELKKIIDKIRKE